MTRLAILADIHGNPHAFEAVIDDIGRQGVDEAIIAGDLVGRGPCGAAVVDRALALGWPCLRGNHEDYALGFIRREVPEPWWTMDIWSASRWIAAEVARHRAFIEALPFSLERGGPDGLLIVHGSPRSNSEGIGAWTSDEDRAALLDGIAQRVLVCAHTHRPFHDDSPRGQIVNIGSVGLPFNGDWRAQYAIFDDAQGDWAVEFRQISYDREAFLNLYAESGFLEQGGLTAALLKIEVEQARPFLMPFLKWASQRGFDDPAPAMMARFLEIFDPTLPTAAQIERLERG